MKLMNIVVKDKIILLLLLFIVIFFIVKNRLIYIIIEKFVKLVLKLMINIMFGEKVKWVFGKNFLLKVYYLEK